MKNDFVILMNKINKKKTASFLIILFILIIAFFLRLLPIRIAHFWDETVYLQHAEIFFSGRTNFDDELSFRPPLLSIKLNFAFFIKHLHQKFQSS